ncbi:MAG: SDR family oxidoreductase [Ferruginibacter sp.]|nr:SDR family oxidoreductase [Ferruginibacter sp.]
MNIVITGASRGIGRAIAEAFAAEGHTLFLCARNKEVLEKTALEIMQSFPQCSVKFLATELSDVNNAEAFANFCIKNSIPHILINNAGSFVPGNILEETENALQEMLNSNLFSAYYLTKKIAPSMVKNATGHIINICSIAGLQAYNNGGSYGISKFAMNGFSQNLRNELKETGVKVTTVFPGAVYTDSWAGFDNTNKRIMEATDIAKMILACTKLSASAVPEEIIMRPQLGDL